MNVVDIIAKKRDGGELSNDEIRYFISNLTAGSVPEYQAAAWLMAVFIRGLNQRETLDLTLAMRDSGSVITSAGLAGGLSLDKHSTGGVGDKTTLIVAPILASAGVPMLKMSGRGLGFSGGTIDKLESIPGVRTDFAIDEAKRIMDAIGIVIIAQSASLAPADKILYSLRDVTATVECLPLIASSIMSKKLAAGGERILLDVKCGLGAFMKNLEEARELATELKSIGNGAGVPTTALISSMDVPLGQTVGNSLEVRESFEMLIPECHLRDRYSEYWDLCLELAAGGLLSVGRVSDIAQGRSLAQSLVDSGAAAAKLAQLIHMQGGAETVQDILKSLPQAKIQVEVRASRTGRVAAINAERIGRLSVEIGAGRKQKTDTIDPAAGIVLYCKVGEVVETGTVLAVLHFGSENEHRISELSVGLLNCYTILDLNQSQSFVAPTSLVIEWCA